MKVRVLAMEANRSGGAAVYTAELIRQLAGRGHHLSLICFRASPDLFDIAKVWQLARFEFGTIPLAWRLSGWFEKFACDHFVDRLDLDAPDILIGSSQQLLRSHARRYPNLPFIYLPHSLVAARGPDLPGTF